MKKIRVENLGVIKEGEVDISKPLTIFTGPNNSGKSYMAYLVYGYYSITRPQRLYDNTLHTSFKQAQVQAFEKEQVLEKYFSDFGISIKLNDIRREFIYDIHSQITSNVLEVNSSEIFATNINYKCNLEIEDIYINLGDLTAEVVINSKIYTIFRSNNTHNVTSDTPITIEQKNDITQYIYRLLSYVYGSTYFFPAERSSIHLFSKELLQKKANTLNEVAKIIESNDAENSIKKIKANGSLIPRYPLAINDYLSYSSDFEYSAKQPKTEFEDLAKELEAILEGRILVNAYGSLEFKPKGTRKNLPLHLSSSMVKSLGGLVIYLRHLAREHDHIIIDEPELNLHPSTQVKLARLLAKIANRGIKLLISTHSNHIIRELSNLILLSDDFEEKKALQKKYRYKKDDFIKAEDVGVYAFQNQTIEKVSITEQGIEIDKIRKVIGDMNLRSDDIYYIHLDSLEDAAI